MNGRVLVLAATVDDGRALAEHQWRPWDVAAFVTPRTNARGIPARHIASTAAWDRLPIADRLATLTQVEPAIAASDCRGCVEGLNLALRALERESSISGNGVEHVCARIGCNVCGESLPDGEPHLCAPLPKSGGSDE